MMGAKRTRPAWRIALSAALLFAPCAAVADAPETIRTLVGRGELLQLRHRDFSTYRAALDAFYRPSGYAPQWLDRNGTAQSALKELSDARLNGLDPADYDADWIGGEFEAIAAGDRPGERGARADLALTVSLFRLLDDVHRGRVSPEEAGFKFRSVHTPLDLPGLLRSALDGGNVHDAVAAAEPSFPLYQHLKEVLAHYRETDAGALPPIPPLPKKARKIEPGSRYAGVAAIAERLKRTRDLADDAEMPQGDRYDGPVVDAVRAFQERHGLKADGVLGRDTLAALDAPLAVRVRQIELSLERMRWLPELPPGPVVAVNIPSFRLWAFVNARKDTSAQLTMPVIVGGAVSAKKTPVFIGEMRYLEFSPYWNVPPGILKKEILPKLRRDPAYWEREQFEAVPVRGGEPITSLSATTLSGLESGALRLRQRPGEKNAVGEVKFVLPNTMDIYLHGTPAKGLFERARRDFSHGCIRVQDPSALAQFVLADQSDWTPERTSEAMDAGTMSTARLTRPIPVIIFYTTAIVDAKNRVLFQSDIYGYDQKLVRALKAR
jgi:murein L,D-transpeptidase YcbB/YkuD